ncbi:zinc transporter ZIP1-like [Periplaneta americana]|uniref:zinc transporter ZIP1-like n=1 Tax=Periplaneta americana TaxID=6978 RepID=UPI0037E82FAA
MEHEHGDDEGIVLAKVVAMVVLSLATFLLGMLPTKLSSWLEWNRTVDGVMQTSRKSRTILSLMLCFGGGALLCTTFLHMLPEVRESIEDLQGEEKISKTSFHLPELVMCCGFFTMYLVEEFVHLYLHRREKSKGVSKIDNVIHRSFSVRKCSGNKENEQDGAADIPARSDDTSSQKVLHDYPITLSTDEINKSGQGYDEVRMVVPPHPHSHIPVSSTDDPIVASVRGLLVVLALSIHELFEGLAVGLQTSTSFVWYMLGAVSAHKLVIAFCVGIELVSSRTRLMLTVIYISTFALVSPIGIGIGIGLSESAAESVEGGAPNAILQGMATGTLLYVVFFEVLQRERANKQSGLFQLLAIMTGFGIMFGLLIAAGHNHEHEHDHHEEEELQMVNVTDVVKMIMNSTEHHGHHHHHHH